VGGVFSKFTIDGDGTDLQEAGGQKAIVGGGISVMLPN